MYKMKMELDFEQLEKDGYDSQEAKRYLDTELTKRNITKNEEGFYVGGSFGAFGAVIVGLIHQEWFTDHVTEWKWYNSDGNSNPEDYRIEDIIEFYNSDRYKEIMEM